VLRVITRKIPIDWISTATSTSQIVYFAPMQDFEPIRITGVIEQDITKPRNDGTPGSALYRVPFQLSPFPPSEWADYFPRAWDHPSSWTSSHRPGICTVEGDVVWLNGTTLEEIERTHKKNLLLALEETNQKYAEFLAKRNAEIERRQREQEAHQKHVSEISKRIKFD
jgi:hypothetical protein